MDSAAAAINAAKNPVILAGWGAYADGQTVLAIAEKIKAPILIYRNLMVKAYFALDTGRLNEETYEVAEAVRRRFGIRIEWHFPRREAVEQLERAKGLLTSAEKTAFF